MIAAILRRYAFGILPRYVLGQLLRAFALSLTTLTAVFVLFVVVSKVSANGLGPRDILLLVPFAIPGTLPYTVPVALLFSVSVVFGRLGSDNEVIAVKASGMSAMTVLFPALIFGAVLSVVLFHASNDWIPRANRAARLAIMRNVESMFYQMLKKERQFNGPIMPFFIKVGDVQDKTLIDAFFFHRSKTPDVTGPYDLGVFAEKATIRFDTARELVIVRLANAVVQGGSNQPDIGLISNEQLEIPIAGRDRQEASLIEMGSAELLAEQTECRRKILQERKGQAMAAALWIASGRIRRVSWDRVQSAFGDYEHWRSRYRKLETERHMRAAVAFGAFFFVMLGAPVGVWRARGDFLSAFIICFLPIIVLYYPLTLAGVNLGKEGLLNPFYALWAGNLLLAVLSGFVLKPILRH